MIVDKVIEDYMRDTLIYRKPATYDYYSNTFRPVLAHFHGRECESIAPECIERYATARLKEGAGRTISKEISALETACRQKGLTPQWPLPRQLYGLAKRERVVPCDSDVARVYDNVNRECLKAFGLALFAGLRSEEIVRIRREHIDEDRRVITVPGSIRKVAHSRRLPLVGTLAELVTDCNGEIISVPKRHIENELRRVSRWVGCEHEWRGLQILRGVLVTWIEEETGTRNSDLIAGHARSDMASHYTTQMGHMELKREILEAVEHRLHRALEADRIDQ